MFWNRTDGAIAEVWENETAHKLETGGVPLWVTGAPGSVLVAWPALAAWQTLASRRMDVTQPLLPVGGVSPVWLAHLLAPQVAGPGPRPRDPAVLFAGADPVTVHATLAAVAADVAAPALEETIAGHVALDFAPRLVPGAAMSWETLPLLEIGEQPPAPTVEGVAVVEETGTAVDWPAWGALLLAFCLVLSAVLI